MSDITLKRGNKTITFKKMPEHFAVRSRRGRVATSAALAAAGARGAAVRHIDSDAPDNLEIFAVESPSDLEPTMEQLRDSPASEVVTHMYTLDDAPGGGIIPTGTMTIGFKPDVTDQAKEDLLKEYGLEIVDDIDYLPSAHTVRLTAASTLNPLKIAAALQQRPEIATAEPDLAFQVALHHIPADTHYPEQWHLNNRGHTTGLIAGADVKAEAAWDRTRGDRNIRVCIVDDGFDLQHPDLQGPGKIVAPFDFGGPDSDPSPGSADDNHGTACAGVAIAEENGQGTVGLAPGCAFMPIRMSMWLSDESIRQLFQYCIDNEADVISCSWSAQAWNFPLSVKMDGIIRKAATQGRRNGKGCIILFAAGNENRPLSGTASNGQPSHQGFALHPNVCAVAASNSLDLRSSYSNFGPELAFCAPSNGSPGRGIFTVDRRGGSGYSASDYTSSFGGTSSATPLAAGLAALILSVNPDLTSAEVKQIMMDSADKIDAANGEYVEGHSKWFGHGRINAQRALALAAPLPGDPAAHSHSLSLEHRIRRPIPDTNEVIDTIPFPLDVPVQSVEVNIEVRHTWRGDLRVTLTPPGGDGIILADRSGGSSDDIVESFRSADNPASFANILNRSALGDWQLRVEDLAQGDVGTLVKWGLAITYNA